MAEDTGSDFGSAFERNLWRRIISGAVMGVLTLSLLYAGPRPFTVLVIMVAILMSWEWGRMVRVRRVDPAFLIHCATIVFAAVLTVLGQPLLAVITLAIGAILVLLVVGPLDTNAPDSTFFDSARIQSAMTSAFGVFYIGIPLVAMLWLRADTPYGFHAVLFIFIIVWAADTAAFIGGKTFGGFKLWPSVSPNKTWAGFLSAMLAAGIIGAVFASVLAPQSMHSLVVKSLLLGAVAQIGDLAESALKRGFGVKDASDLIPGHGGFMDRLDGVVAVAAIAGLLALLVQPNEPARALLFGP